MNRMMPPETTFHLCCAGAFSGQNNKQANIGSLSDPEGLLAELQPKWRYHVDWSGMDHLSGDLTFQNYTDFLPENLAAQTPVWRELQILSRKVDSHTGGPFLIEQAQDAYPFLKWIPAPTVSKTGLDTLLSMVDLGEPENKTYPRLHDVAQGRVIHGVLGMKGLAEELKRLQQEFHQQILNHPEFQTLAGQWHALKILKNISGDNIQLTILDCSSDDLCETFYRHCFQNKTPVDLALVFHDFANYDPDRETLRYLGKMAASLNTPICFETSPVLLDCKQWSEISKLDDASQKLTSPGMANWRTLRAEEGSSWLFASFNPLLLETENTLTQAPAGMVLALMVVRTLSRGLWPVLGPGSNTEVPNLSGTAAPLSHGVARSLASHGFMPVGIMDNGSIGLYGAHAFAQNGTVHPNERNQKIFVQHSFSHRFFTGWCSRFFERHGQSSNFREQLCRAGNLDMTSIELDDQNGIRSLTVQAPFQIAGEFPEIHLSMRLE